MGTKKDPRDLLREPEKTDRQMLNEERVRNRLKQHQRESRQVISALERELRDAGRRQQFLDALVEAPTPKPYQVRKKRGQGKRLPAATYVMAASDWHVEERVRPEVVNWRNEYNPEIAQERAAQFWHSNLKMLNAARSAWDIRQGVLWLGGDLITGYIHEELEEDNYLSPTEASLLVSDILDRGIRFLLDRSDLEHLLIPTSHGNHGRTFKKPRVATAAKNSYEWLVYRFLEKKFADEPRVKFQVANGYHNLVDLYGFRIRFHHGDAIGYGGGIGGLSIPVNRRIGRQAAADERPVNLDVFGHFHTLQFPKGFIVNGSLIGWNAYAERLGFGFEPPAQASFVVDEKHKVVSNFNPILVE